MLRAQRRQAVAVHGGAHYGQRCKYRAGLRVHLPLRLGHLRLDSGGGTGAGDRYSCDVALLELLRQHRIIVYQNAAFHEITVLPSKEMPDDKPLEAPDDYGG